MKLEFYERRARAICLVYSSYRLKKAYEQQRNLHHSQRENICSSSVSTVDSCYASDDQINTSPSQLEPSIPDAMISDVSDSSSANVSDARNDKETYLIFKTEPNQWSPGTQLAIRN